MRKSSIFSSYFHSLFPSNTTAKYHCSSSSKFYRSSIFDWTRLLVNEFDGHDFSSLRGHESASLSAGWICCRGTPWDVPADRWSSIGPGQPVRPCEGGLRIDVGVRRRGWKSAAWFSMGDDSVSGHFGWSGTTAGQSDRVAFHVWQTK